MADQATQDQIEAVVLEALTQRLEAALDLAASAEAIRRLGEIAQLCSEAAQIASCGRLLLA